MNELRRLCANFDDNRFILNTIAIARVRASREPCHDHSWARRAAPLRALVSRLLNSGRGRSARICALAANVVAQIPEVIC